MKFKVGQTVIVREDSHPITEIKAGDIGKVVIVDAEDPVHTYLVEVSRTKTSCWYNENHIVAVPPEVETDNKPKQLYNIGDPITLNYLTTTQNTGLTISQLQKEVHELAKEKGWYDPPKTDLECMALIHSEISEAVEELRSNEDKPYVYHSAGHGKYIIEPKDGWNDTLKPEGLASELADAVIRILDYCEWKGINLEEAIKLKHAYNRTRPYRHGKKI